MGVEDIDIGVGLGKFVDFSNEGLIAIENDNRRKDARREPKKNLILEMSLLGKIIFGSFVPTARTTKENTKRKKKTIDQFIKKCPLGH